MLKSLNSLWVGDQLGYLEKLCLASASAVGHQVTLYSYTPKTLKRVPEGIEVRDAQEVMPRDMLVTYSDSGSFALGSNFFRYALLAKGLGYWVDMDFCFLKPLDFEEPYVFGWQDEKTINNGILHAPSQSHLVHDLCEMPGTNRRPPWFGPKRTLFYYWDRLMKGKIGVQDLPWGTYGPGMLTFLAKKYRVADKAQGPSVFYPIRHQDARLLYGPAEVIEAMIAHDTRAIHMWHSALFGLRDVPPPSGSYIEAACRRHGIKTA